MEHDPNPSTDGCSTKINLSDLRIERLREFVGQAILRLGNIKDFEKSVFEKKRESGEKGQSLSLSDRALSPQDTTASPSNDSATKIREKIRLKGQGCRQEVERLIAINSRLRSELASLKAESLGDFLKQDSLEGASINEEREMFFPGKYLKELLAINRAAYRLFNAVEYGQMRPDVNKRYKSSKPDLFNHFVSRGAWETDFGSKSDASEAGCSSHLDDHPSATVDAWLLKESCAVLSNAVIMPIERYLHPSIGGVAWPDWKEWERFRLQLNNSYDDSPQGKSVFDGLAIGDMTTLGGEWVWGGFAIPHYGHLIADFLPRVINYYALQYALENSDPCKKIVFAGSPSEGRDGLSQADLLKSILSFLVDEPLEIKVITSPVTVDRLHVAVQGESRQAGGGSASTSRDGHYINYLINNQKKRHLGGFIESRKLYVSRSGLSSKSAKFAGGEFLEATLEQNGYMILRPESRSLTTQVHEIAKAGEIVFDEGSALHTLQLFGHLKSKVTLLCRSRAPRMAINCVASRLAKPLRVVNSCCGLVRAECASEAQQLSLLDCKTLESALGVRLRSVQFFEIVMHDIETYCQAWKAEAAGVDLQFECNLDEASPDYSCYRKILCLLSARHCFTMGLLKNPDPLRRSWSQA